MILSRYGLILLHVPKTGGNSLHHGLLSLSDDEMVTSRHGDGVDRFGIVGLSPGKHATLAQYSAVVDLDRFRVAVTVRDPVERAVSLYYSPHRWYAEGGGRWVLQRPVWDWGAFSKMLAVTPSASDFLKVEGRVREPDFVLRQETLVHDYGAMTAALDIPAGRLPWVNRSAAGQDERRAALGDPDVQQAVRARFAEDYARFGY